MIGDNFVDDIFVKCPRKNFFDSHNGICHVLKTSILKLLVRSYRIIAQTTTEAESFLLPRIYFLVVRETWQLGKQLSITTT